MEHEDVVVSIDPDIADVVKGADHLPVKLDSNVHYLTPQAAALARMAAEATCGTRDEGWDIRPHPMLEAAGPSLDQFEQPSTAPVAVMRNPVAGRQVIADCSDLASPVPINTEAVPFESALMIGQLKLHIRGLQSTDQSVFNGKKRFLHIAMQGRLKRDVKASDIWTGHEWFQISQLVPTSFVNIAYTAAAKMFSCTTRVCASTENGQIAGFLNPMLASCQICNVSEPGQEPDIGEAQEDMRLLSQRLADKDGNPLSPDKRRRWFDNSANADSVILSKDFVYTMHSWQHWCNIASYRLQLNSVLSFDLCQFSEGQPLQIMAKDQATGEYIINLLLWHKNLLYKDRASDDTHSVRDRLKAFKHSWQGMLTRSK